MIVKLKKKKKPKKAEDVANGDAAVGKQSCQVFLPPLSAEAHTSFRPSRGQEQQGRLLGLTTVTNGDSR